MFVTADHMLETAFDLLDLTYAYPEAKLPQDVKMPAIVHCANGNSSLLKVIRKRMACPMQFNSSPFNIGIGFSGTSHSEIADDRMIAFAIIDRASFIRL